MSEMQMTVMQIGPVLVLAFINYMQRKENQDYRELCHKSLSYIEKLTEQVSHLRVELHEAKKVQP